MTNEEMFEQNMRLAYKLANKYSVNHAHEIEDIKQIALMGLWKAVLAYDKQRSKFCTFAVRVILNEINMYLRKNKKRKERQEVSLSTIVFDNVTLEDTIQDSRNDIEDLEDRIEKQEIREIKNKELRKMKKIHQEIYLCLEKGMKQREIAKKMNLSQAAISRIQRRLIKRVKQEYVKK